MMRLTHLCVSASLATALAFPTLLTLCCLLATVAIAVADASMCPEPEEETDR